MQEKPAREKGSHEGFVFLLLSRLFKAFLRLSVEVFSRPFFEALVQSMGEKKGKPFEETIGIPRGF